MYKIEKDIKIPKSRASKKYPFNDMEIGDSFFVEIKDKSKLKKARHAVYASCRSYTRSHSSVKFITRLLETGVRIWRTK